MTAEGRRTSHRQAVCSVGQGAPGWEGSRATPPAAHRQRTPQRRPHLWGALFGRVGLGSPGSGATRRSAPPAPTCPPTPWSYTGGCPQTASRAAACGWCRTKRPPLLRRPDPRRARVPAQGEQGVRARFGAAPACARLAAAAVRAGTLPIACLSPGGVEREGTWWEYPPRSTICEAQVRELEPHDPRNEHPTC